MSVTSIKTNTVDEPTRRALLSLEDHLRRRGVRMSRASLIRWLIQTYAAEVAKAEGRA